MRRTVLTPAWVLTALLLLGLSPGIATAVFVVDPIDCPGVLLTGPGSYRLTVDLVNCSVDRHLGPPPPITIDLDGHTWSGSFLFLRSEGNRLTHGTFDASTLWIAGSLDHLTIRNGSNFVVETYGPLTVSDCTFESNTVALSSYYQGDATVQSSVFRNNTFGFVNGRGSGSLVASSTFENNGSGVLLWDEDFTGSNDVVVRGNHFSGNTLAIGVEALIEVHRARIVNNEVDENGGAGISVDVFCHLLPPVRPCGGQGSVIEGNHLRGNGFAAASTGAGDGIRVRGVDERLQPVDPTGITLSGNQADRNADLGLDAPGVTDGGRNRATFNGDPQQCVGVECGVPGFQAPGKRAAARAAADAERLWKLLAALPRH